MSGFVAAFGRPDRKIVERMFQKIQHRGRHDAGIWEQNGTILAQNYLHADGAGDPGQVTIPVPGAEERSLRICYDGQMGNWQDLGPRHDVADGPYREERLLLEMYQQYGIDMLSHLSDTLFALVVSDGDDVLIARDLLGIKTLFYGWKGDTLYLCSELKGIVEATPDVREFPPGHYMDRRGNPTSFASLPETPPENMHTDLDEQLRQIRAIIRRSLDRRVDFRLPTGGLLSGGIDSSVINCLATEKLNETFGSGTRLKTFALGMGESEDIRIARVVSDHINSEHHELIVDLDKALEVLPDVIYYLESFDPSLVRSSVSNFLISERARDAGIEILLSGEGGDEVFCGYIYLKDYPLEEQFSHQMDCMRFLHSNASLRLDRMNQCHGVKVVAPLISGELLNYSLAIPPEYKQRREAGEIVEKWIFRKTFERDLPKEVIWRLKQEFSQGSGSADILKAHFENAIADNELEEAREKYPQVRSKEELYYFRIFTEHFGVPAADTVGQWVCL